MDRLTFSQRLTDILIMSRECCMKSQEYMARALGVSKKTISNWECGTSSPSLPRLFDWFQALEIQPTPYILRLVFPQYNEIDSNSCDSDIEQILIKLIQNQPPEAKRQLLYLLSGKHGSSPAALLNMITAHLQSPLRDRINVALSISTNYKLAQLTRRIVCPENVQPDIDLLNFAIEKGMEAAADGKEYYSAIFNEEEVNL